MHLKIPAASRVKDWLIGILLAVVVFAAVAVIVMVSLFGLDQPSGEPKWITISELHTTWDHGTNSMHISITGTVQQSCARIVVTKAARKIDAGEAAAVPDIQLYGSLARKLQTIQPGPFTVFDQARPKTGYMMPDHYLMTVTLFCELNGENKTTLASEPASAILVVPQIPIREIPRKAPA